MSRLRWVVALFAVMLVLPACGGDDEVTVGGQLYDKWWAAADGAEEPSADHPLWAQQSTNERSGSDTYRCKECHGWDYQGAAGAYGSGSHFTGFPGIYDARSDLVDDVVAALSGGIADHDFSDVLGEDEIAALAAFVTTGLVDMRPLFDLDTKAVRNGDAAEGEDLYGRNCAACHGSDGTTLNFGDDDEPEYVGGLSRDNPWEVAHKILFGHPGSSPKMPAQQEEGWGDQELRDVIAHLQTLP